MIDNFFTNMQIFTSQDVNWWTWVMWITCGLLWCFYQLSFWRHPFTAESSWGPEGEYIFIFGWTIFIFFINRGNNITMSAFLLCLTDHNVSSLVFVGKAPLFDSNLTWHQELLIQPCSQSQLLMTSRESGAVKVCAVWKCACNTALKFPQNHYLGLFPNRVMGNTE